MHLPLDPDTWQQRLNYREVRKGHSEFLDSTTSQLVKGEQRASFHFPLPLRAMEPPTPDDTFDFSTVVVVPVAPGKEDELRDSVETFQQRHLNFIGLFDDRRNLDVSFDAWGNQFRKSSWPSADPEDANRSLVFWKLAELQQLADEADQGCPRRHEQKRPRTISNTGDHLRRPVEAYRRRGSRECSGNGEGDDCPIHFAVAESHCRQ